MLRTYLTELAESVRQGDAREESFYPALKSLLTKFSNSTNRKNIHVTVLPKKTDAGNPDFRIWDGKRRIVGYIEAKVFEKNLDEVDKTEQICRYSATFPNFIVTNFIEFRLYKNGSCIDKVSVSELKNIYGSRGTIQVKAENEFETLMEKFFSFSEVSNICIIITLTMNERLLTSSKCELMTNADESSERFKAMWLPIYSNCIYE